MNNKNIKPNLISLHPWAVTGFADAKGCFNIKISKNYERNIGWHCQLIFLITLNSKDLNLLYEIQNFFRVGQVNLHNNVATYTVSSIKDLAIIINHFINYPLITNKSSDFVLWQNAYNLIVAKSHFTLKGFEKLVALKSSMNLGLSDSIKYNFKNIIPFKRPLFVFNAIPNDHWIAGFLSGDGSLSVKVHNSNSYKLGKRVELNLSIIVHIRDTAVLKGISKYLLNSSKSEFIYPYSRRNTVQFLTKSLSTINKNIIPFLDQFSLIGAKRNDYILFKEVVALMKNKEHLKEAGLTKIIAIKEKMNKYE